MKLKSIIIKSTYKVDSALSIQYMSMFGRCHLLENQNGKKKNNFGKIFVYSREKTKIDPQLFFFKLIPC